MAMKNPDFSTVPWESTPIEVSLPKVMIEEFFLVELDDVIIEGEWSSLVEAESHAALLLYTNQGSVFRVLPHYRLAN